jgi:endonuclease YncB( thermonuclease family)
MHRFSRLALRLRGRSLALCMLGLLVEIPAHAQDALPVLVGTVTKIVDGDTIDVQLSSGPMRVRLHGVDTPERGQPWGKESTAALTDLVMGKEVDIEPFSQDRYERMIGIVFLGDLNVNLELVKRGHAWAYRQYMRKEDSALCINEAAARTAKKGLWALPVDQRIPPWEWRRKKTRAAPTDYSQETAAECIAAIGKS